MTELQTQEQGPLTLRPVAWYRGLLPENSACPGRAAWCRI